MSFTLRTLASFKLHTRNFSSTLRYISRHLLLKFILGFLLLLLLFRLVKPSFFMYGLSYARIIIDMVNTDLQRQDNVTLQEARIMWDLHHLQKKYMREYCKENARSEQYAWFISMSGNRVVPGAVIVGHLLKKLSCFPTLIALVTDTLSQSSRTALQAVGFDVHVVDALDCNWMDRKMGASLTNKGIPGTHTRFHAWRYTQYKKITYVDTDFFPLVNMDELFELPGEFSAVYCDRPGVLDPCFNAGLAVFRPDPKTYQGLLEKWEEMTHVLGCPNDQLVLWYYFAFAGRWNPLPYSYNVRRKVYYPMKAYHFAGYNVRRKPWEMKKPTTRKEARSFRGPILERDEMDILWWKIFYEALDEHNLHKWWNTTEFYKPFTEDNKRYHRRKLPR